jgi:uncharacterized protein YecT (DUF1311 family)
MKLGLVVFAFAVFCSSSPASALDCVKASSKIEKLFCATPELKKADEAMGSAYFKLLHETVDPKFHEALIQSQRRWLKVRSDGPDRFGQAEGDKTDDRDILLQMTRDRLRFLQTGEPIRIMEAQRKATSGDSGGPFAGFRTSCVLQPPPYANWAFECWGSVHRQNTNRVCSSVKLWASGHSTEYRLVSVLEGGKPKQSAVCSTESSGDRPLCPGLGDTPRERADARWDTNFSGTLNFSADLDPGGLWEYDPDIGSEVVEEPWLNGCLTSSNFPPSKSSPDKK